MKLFTIKLFFKHVATNVCAQCDKSSINAFMKQNVVRTSVSAAREINLQLEISVFSVDKSWAFQNRHSIDLDNT